MNSFFKIYNAVLLVLYLVLYVIIPVGVNDAIIWTSLFVFYFYFLRVLFSRPLVISGGITTVFRMDILFLIFYYLLFYLPYQTFLMGINNIKSNDWISNTFMDYTNKSVILSTIGLIMFVWGFEIKIKAKPQADLLQWTKKQYYFLYKVILFMFGITFVVFMLTGWAVLIASYSPNTGDNTTDGISFLVSLFAALIFSFDIFLYKKYGKLNPLIVSGCIASLFWCVLLLIIGDRNTFFLVIIPLIGGVFTYIRSIGLGKLTFMILLALVLYQVIEKTRSSGKRGFDAVVEVLEHIADGKQKVNSSLDKSSFSITNITSRASFFCVDRYGFFYGKFKLISFAGIVPYSRALIVKPNDPFTDSSKVLTTEMLGADSIWGVGTNVISDIYMDFGVAGVIILMYLLGVSGKYVQNNAKVNPDSIKWCVIYLISIGLFAEIPRYSLGFPARNIAWALFIFFLYNKFVVKRQFNRNLQRQQFSQLNEI